MISWAREKGLAWDVTVVDTSAQYIQSGGSRNQPPHSYVEDTKSTNISDTQIFVPVAIETGAVWDQQPIEFIEELGKRISVVTKGPKETQYLFQKLSMATQRSNAISFQSTFSLELWSHFSQTIYPNLMLNPLALETKNNNNINNKNNINNNNNNNNNYYYYNYNY